MALVIPVILQNGDIADADEVMEDFDFIAAHAPSGPPTSAVNNLASWNDTTGTTLQDSGIVASAVLTTPLAYASLPAAAAVQATPANPSGTSNTTGVMMGLAVAITPIRSGKLLIMASFEMDGGGADSPSVGIRRGTGAAPANGAALTGTASGSLRRSFLANANELVPGSCVALVTGLTVNTAVWIDLSLKSTSGGSVSVQAITIVAIEL